MQGISSPNGNIVMVGQEKDFWYFGGASNRGTTKATTPSTHSHSCRVRVAALVGRMGRGRFFMVVRCFPPMRMHSINR